MKTINQTRLNYKEDQILKGSLEHRLLILLNNLYKDYHFTTLKDYFKKHRIGAFRTGILIDLGFIEQVKYAQYIWIADKPTVKDAIKLTNHIRKIQKEWAKKHKEKNKIRIDAKARLMKMKTNSVTEINNDKYVNIKEAEKLTRKTSRTIRYHIAKYKETHSKEETRKMFPYKEDENGNYILYINIEFLKSLYPLLYKNKDIELEKKEVVKNEPKEKEIKSKYISLLWGLFKFESKSK